MASPAALGDLVAPYSAGVRDLVLRTRALILECVPGAEETADLTGHVALQRASDLERPGVKALLRAADAAWKRRGQAKTGK